jgi:hypothetical protein
MSKPFLPNELPAIDPLKDWRRYVLARCLASLRNQPAERIMRELFQDADTLKGVLRAAELVQRGAVAPASTTGWGQQLIGPPAVAAFLRSLAPVSAAARLLLACSRVELASEVTASLPRFAAPLKEPTFVAEGAPIPVIQGSMESAVLGPVRKLAMITGLTGELAAYSAESALEVLEIAMRDAAANSLDAAVFGAGAATAIAPAGLLNGVTPIAAASNDLPGDAMVKDLAALAGAIADAGGGSGVLYFANPRQETAIRLRSPEFAQSVVPAPRLPEGSVVAVETQGIASAFDGLPDVDLGRVPVLHYEDASPAQIGTPGTPNLVAAPAVSGYQTMMLALRLILDCAWAKRMKGAVQVVNGVQW